MSNNRDIQIIDLVARLKEVTGNQVTELVAKAIKDEYDVYNGIPPKGAAMGTGRIGQLQKISDPRYKTPSVVDGTTNLYVNGNEDDGIVASVTVNNNPLYPSNMLKVLNTPFDHIERIVLEDFSP